MIPVSKKIFFLIAGAMVMITHSACQRELGRQVEISETIRHRKMDIQRALQQNIPVIRLYTDPSKPEYKAQEIALGDPRWQEMYKDPRTGKAMLNEVFSVSHSRPADFPLHQAECNQSGCYRVEVYNYAKNGLIISIVDINSIKIISSSFYESMQGDIPPHLAELAIAIAAQDSAVLREYGGTMNASSSRMSSTKTALNHSRCQRSMHLCVAPTFVKGDKALWTIVDLTELKVAGTKWTDVGRTGMPLTERIYQNEKIMKCYCEVENHVERDGWSFSYSLTRSDGLKIGQVKFNGQPLFNSVKLMDWHVSYSKTEGFGYSDAIGCPEYSNAAVVAIEAPEFKALVKNRDTIGFELVQQYFSEGWPTPCSYNYAQHYEFYRDGSFRPVVASLGRGCGSDGTYRPVTRISFAGTSHTIEQFKNNTWEQWQKEAWYLQSEADQYQDGRYIFKLKYQDGRTWMIEANKGQFGDGGRGDNAYFYVTRLRSDREEGEVDLPTLGPCCNIDYRQGPEKFIEPEALDHHALVLWYVPQIQNDNRSGKEYCWSESVLEDGVYKPRVWPCPSGLKFSPSSTAEQRQ